MEGATTNDVVIEIPDSKTPSHQSRNNLSTDGCISPNSIAIEQSTILTVGSFKDAKKQSKQAKAMVVVQSIALLIATFTIIISLLLHLQLWKWFAFILIVSCSWLVTGRMVSTLFFLIERYLVMKTSMILYFGCGLKRSALYFFRFGSILLAWGLLIGLDAKGSKWIYYVTNSLATCVIGTGIWILKIVILKVLACGLLCDKKFLDKIQELISQEYVLQTLIGVPAKGDGTVLLKWITEACVNGKRFFILCDALNRTLDDDEDETLINQEVGIIVSQISKNLKKNELREIHEVDLLQVIKEEEVPNVLKLFEGAVETKVIDEASFKKWIVKVLNERKTMVHPFSDAITELNNIMSGIVLFLVSIIWLCFMDFATTRVLVFIGSLVVFSFGPAWNNISGGIILVFQQRPFDVGDCCVVDNEQLTIEKMGIWQTVFLRRNNEKFYCTTASLLTKSIKNYNRSIEIRDILEIIFDGSTLNENIAALELEIDKYVKENPKIWRPNHSFQIQEKEDKKWKYNLGITHAINFQNYKEWHNRRSELVFELTKISERLRIKSFSVRHLT